MASLISRMKITITIIMGVIRVQGPFFNFRTLPKFGMYEARKFKFSVRIDLGKSHLMDEKYLVGGVVRLQG